MLITIVFPTQIDIAIVIFLACSLYAIYRKKFQIDHQVWVPFSRCSKKWLYLFHIAFCLIFIAGLIIYQEKLYHRSLIYFIVIVFMAIIIVLEIYMTHNEKHNLAILFEIGVLSILITYGLFYVYPSFFGSDSYWHANIAQQITNTGFIQPIEVTRYYAQYPIFHLELSIPQIVLGFDIKTIAFVTLGITHITTILMIYSIGKQLFGTKVGLVSALVAAVESSLIKTGVEIIPDSLFLCFFCIIIYLLLKKEQGLSKDIIIIITTVVLIISHPLSAFVLFVALMGLYIGIQLHAIIYKQDNKFGLKRNYLYLIFVVIAMQSYWMFTYSSPRLTVYNWLLEPLIGALRTLPEFAESESVTYAVQYSFMTNTLFHLGYLVVLLLGILGVLVLFGDRDTRRFLIGFTPLVLLVFIYGIPAFGLDNMLTGRWSPFMTALIVIPASFSLSTLLVTIKPKIVSYSFTLMIIACLVFFNVTAPGINKDNPLYAKERAIRTQFTSSEIVALQTLNKLCSNIMKSDLLYLSTLGRQISLTAPITAFDLEYIETQDHKDLSGTLIILRSSLLDEPTTVYTPGTAGSRTRIQVTPQFFHNFNTPSFNLVYINSSLIYGYLTN